MMFSKIKNAFERYTDKNFPNSKKGGYISKDAREKARKKRKTKKNRK